MRPTILLAVCLLGCSSEATPLVPPVDASVETADAPEVAVADDCDEYAAAQCGYNARCGTRWFFDLQYASDAECRAYLAKRCRSVPPLAGTTTTYRAECIAALRDGECTAAAVCSKGGTLVDGESCLSAAQCSSGYCKPGDGCGTCGAAPTTGDSCGPHVLCGSSDMRCDATTAKCVPVSKLGESCAIGDCALNLSCRGGLCVKSAGEGETCGSSMDGAPDCEQGLACAAGTCAKFVVVEVGETCDDARLCRGRCVSGKCVAAAPIGGACTKTSDCGWWARCREGACELGLGTWECPG